MTGRKEQRARTSNGQRAQKSSYQKGPKILSQIRHKPALSAIVRYSHIVRSLLPISPSAIGNMLPYGQSIADGSLLLPGDLDPSSRHSPFLASNEAGGWQETFSYVSKPIK